MLETIKESKSFKAPLPPRPSRVKDGESRPSTCGTFGRYGGDQDPAEGDEGLEYAKAYHSLKLKALNTKPKTGGQASSKMAEGSPNSENSDQSFICNMAAATEPLYGDPGEEDFWR